MGVGVRLATRPAGWCTDSIGRVVEDRPRSGRDDLRCLPRWGEEGPGRAEGSESGRCEPQGEGSGRDVRPCTRHGLADDRGRRSSRIPRDTQELAAFSSTAADALSNTQEVHMPTVTDRHGVQQPESRDRQATRPPQSRHYLLIRRDPRGPLSSAIFGILTGHALLSPNRSSRPAG